MLDLVGTRIVCFLMQRLIYLFISEALDILSNNPVGDLAMDKQRAGTIVDCKRSIKQLLYHDHGQELKNRLVDVLVNNFMKRCVFAKNNLMKGYIRVNETMKRCALVKIIS